MPLRTSQGVQGDTLPLIALYHTFTLQIMEIWTFWLIVAAALLILELCTSSLTFLYPALGAAAAMCAALLDYGWEVTLPLFGAVSVLLYLATHRVRKRILARLHGSKDEPTGMDALIGRTGRLSGDKDLRLRIDGDNWRVRPDEDGIRLRPGDNVRVTGFDSIVLTVTKTES